MTAAEQLAHDQWLGSLVMSVLVGVVVPLLVFFALCGLAWYLLKRAQAAPDNTFDIAQIFMDDATGKTSMTQILKLGGFMFHTVITIIVVSVTPSAALDVTMAYGATWGVTGAGLEFIKRKWPTSKDGT